MKVVLAPASFDIKTYPLKNKQTKTYNNKPWIIIGTFVFKLSSPKDLWDITFFITIFNIFILCPLPMLLANFSVHLICLQHGFSSVLSVFNSWWVFFRNYFISAFIRNHVWAKSCMSKELMIVYKVPLSNLP